MWVGLQSDIGAKTKPVEIPRRVSHPVGLKPDPQGAEGLCGSGFIPTCRTEVRPTGSGGVL